MVENSINLIHPIYCQFFFSYGCTGVRLLPKSLVIQKVVFTWRLPKSLCPWLHVGEPALVHWQLFLLWDINCLWYLCEVSASSLSHCSYSPTYSVFSKCSASPACEVTEARSESSYSLGGAWWPKDQGWWQWDWMHIYLRSTVNRNEFISKCLWVMKNKVVCSIPDCKLFRGLEDIFLTCVSNEEKWIVCSFASDWKHVISGLHKTEAVKSKYLCPEPLRTHIRTACWEGSQKAWSKAG